MRQYLTSKVQKLAMEPSYYTIIIDETRTEELAMITGLDPSDITHLRSQAQTLRAELDSIEESEFVFAEMHSVIDVFREKQGGQAKR